MNKKPTREEPIDGFMNWNCELSFAYSPKTLLRVSEDKKDVMTIYLSEKGIAKKYINKLSDAVRFIYVCYSLKFVGSEDGGDIKDLHYFFFQPFIIAGETCIPCKIESNFMEMDEVLDLINQISYTFTPSLHEKNILNLPLEDPPKRNSYKVKEILDILADWTDVKINEAHDLFLNNAKLRLKLIEVATVIDAENNKKKGAPLAPETTKSKSKTTIAKSKPPITKKKSVTPKTQSKTTSKTRKKKNEKPIE
jgi:hypothetical protein